MFSDEFFPMEQGKEKGKKGKFGARFIDYCSVPFLSYVIKSSKC